MLSFSGGAVAWKSKAQKLVALSSSEAEYVAASAAAQEALYIQQLVEDMGFGGMLTGVPLLLVDNEAAIKMARNPVAHVRTKHIDIKVKALTGWVKKGLLEIQHVGTADQLADGLTKPLGRAAVEAQRAVMMGQEGAAEYMPQIAAAVAARPETAGPDAPRGAAAATARPETAGPDCARPETA